VGVEDEDEAEEGDGNVVEEGDEVGDEEVADNEAC